MLRKLLALLVLVTGLAAVGQPAQAACVTVEACTRSDAGFACTAQPGQRWRSVRRSAAMQDVSARALPAAAAIVLVVPTVMLQADRARE